MNIEVPGVPLSPTMIATVLVVDDVPENLQLLSEMLSDEGYHPLTAHSGPEALAILQVEHAHLIIADAMMPKMDGLELCKRVRSLSAFRHIPFIIYTGNYIDDEDKELAQVVGVDRYVMKNDGVQTLIATVNELLKTRYGILQEDHSPQIPQIDEQAFLERHHTIVTKKLEDKMRELQQYAETLMKKNRELIASENRSRRLFEDAGIAIFVIDQKTKSIIDVNKQAVTLLEQSKEEILRLPSLSFASMDASIADLYGTQASRMGEAVLQTPKGNMIYVDITSSSIQGMDDSIQTLLFVRDITEKKRMREQLLQAEKMSTMGHIATGIAHEIRNPLAGILLNLQFLDRHLPQGTTDYESVQAALEGVHRVQQVIEDTLGLARVAPPSFREVSMNPLIDKALLYLKLSMRHKSIAIHKQLATHLPRVIIDPNQIQQVLLNMLQNAVDACPDSGCIDVRTDIALQPEVSVQPCVRITIHDSGSGVPAEVLEHLFEPFHTTKTDGTGLGLMLSKYIIDRHHGQITVKNASLGGAEVCIALPAQSIDSEG